MTLAKPLFTLSLLVLMCGAASTPISVSAQGGTPPAQACSSCQGVAPPAGSAPAIPLPAGHDRGVFISQVGNTNTVAAAQDNAVSYTRISQNGDGNRATTAQTGAAHHAVLAQQGEDNHADVTQDGLGQTVLLLAQDGAMNAAAVSQRNAAGTYTAAVVSQTGSGNALVLVQDGADNQVRLTQTGDNNLMTAEQLGDGNRLVWDQNGSGLPDLQISQTGGAAMQITQTGPGG